MGATNHFIHMLGQIGDVEIGRRIVSLSLEARIERFLRDNVSASNKSVVSPIEGADWTYTSESNLVSEKMEASNTLVRVANIAELGEPKSVAIQYYYNTSSRYRQGRSGVTYPLQAPVVVSMIALDVSTAPNLEAYLSKRSSSVVG